MTANKTEQTSEELTWLLNRCPACNRKELFVTRGWITCSNLECPQPDFEQALLSWKDAAVVEAQNQVIAKGHTACECGKGHYGAPVRSITGVITTYCPYARVVLSGTHKEKGQED